LFPGPASLYFGYGGPRLGPGGRGWGLLPPHLLAWHNLRRLAHPASSAPRWAGWGGIGTEIGRLGLRNFRIAPRGTAAVKEAPPAGRGVLPFRENLPPDQHPIGGPRTNTFGGGHLGGPGGDPGGPGPRRGGKKWKKARGLLDGESSSPARLFTVSGARGNHRVQTVRTPNGFGTMGEPRGLFLFL